MSAIDAAALRRRYRRERRLIFAGALSAGVALFFLAALIFSVSAKGVSGMQRSVVALDVFLDPALAGAHADEFAVLIKRALRERFANAQSRAERRLLHQLAGFGAALELRDYARRHPQKFGMTVRIQAPLSARADAYLKGEINAALPEARRKLKDMQMKWLDELRASGEAKTVFDWRFFSSADSRDAELAGIGGALAGSALTMLITFLLAVPVGALAALYLEEFAPRSRWFDLIEISINNLAAVPSIVFGLLGLAVFINFFGMPRATPLVGGLVLSLMTLPTIVIAARAALKSVPIPIRDAALALGATKAQTVFHHILPGALPGILTGAIIGMAQALGETAPLLMIGMVAFVADIPGGFTEAATALPVQIFLWADSPERPFVARTAAAVVTLLCFLLAMNAAAILLRRRLEIKW
jgi:phosphate transport system permease protein